MRANKGAENVLGTIGTVLWSGQITPQIWKSYREQSTLGLSGLSMFIWATSAMFQGVYNIVQNINIPLIVQPQLFGALAALSWIQCLYYGGKRSFRVCVVTFLSYLSVFGSLEVGATYGARALRRHGQHAGDEFVRFFGVTSAVLVSVGLIPQYIEIYRLQEVTGISMVFIAADMAGALFSLLSLAFRDHFDVAASITYLCVFVLDGVIDVCALIPNPRARRRRERERSVLCGAMEVTPSEPVASGDNSIVVRGSQIDLVEGSLQREILANQIDPSIPAAGSPYRPIES